MLEKKNKIKKENIVKKIKDFIIKNPFKKRKEKKIKKNPADDIYPLW